METKVYTIEGQEKGTINLPSMFEAEISPALLHEVVTGYLANQRAGTHSTKSRGEVSGGGRKPWKEKGTGNARAGSNRSPLWRKGGIIFGPKPHGYTQNISQQKRRAALHMALSAKAKDGDILVVDEIVIAEPKTKRVAEMLKKLKLENATVIFASDKVEATLKTGSRNIPGVFVVEAKNLNTYQVMWADKLVLTSAAVEQLK